MDFKIITENWNKFLIQERARGKDPMLYWLIGSWIGKATGGEWKPAAVKMKDWSGSAGEGAVLDHSDLFKGDNANWTILSRLIGFRDVESTGRVIEFEKFVKDLAEEVGKYNLRVSGELLQAIYYFKNHVNQCARDRQACSKGKSVQMDWNFHVESELSTRDTSKSTGDGRRKETSDVDDESEVTYLVPKLSLSVKTARRI